MLQASETFPRQVWYCYNAAYVSVESLLPQLRLSHKLVDFLHLFYRLRCALFENHIKYNYNPFAEITTI